MLWILPWRYFVNSIHFDNSFPFPREYPRHHEQIPKANPRKQIEFERGTSLESRQISVSLERIAYSIRNYGFRVSLWGRVEFRWPGLKRVETDANKVCVCVCVCVFEPCIADRSKTLNRRRIHDFHASPFHTTFNCIYIVDWIWWMRVSELRLEIRRKNSLVVSSVFSWRRATRIFL